MTAGGPVPTRHGRVDGRDVWVFDGLLPDVGRYAAALDVSPFTRTEAARPDTAGHRHWVSEIPPPMLEGQALLEQTLRAVRSVRPGPAHRVHRAYTNMAAFGDTLFTHVDCLADARELTALWYVCTEWDVEWGGETVFYDAEDEIAMAVRPRPGRLVIFDGAIKHVGRAPNRTCYQPRYTLALKLEPEAPTAA
jgi:hypothetical protein